MRPSAGTQPMLRLSPGPEMPMVGVQAARTHGRRLCRLPAVSGDVDTEFRFATRAWW